MDQPNETQRVIPELYFLISKFLSGGPLKETTKTLLKELEEADVLPRRLDWEGNEHRQSYEELETKFTEISWPRLAEVCSRALELARLSGAGPDSGSLSSTGQLAIADRPAEKPATLGVEGQDKPITDGLRVKARLSLLSDGLVRERPKYASYKRDHSLVRRLASRETGLDPSTASGGLGGRAVFPARLLAGLGLQRRTLGHLSAVYCLAFDPTGQYVVTGADDLLIKVWSAIDGRLLATLRGAGAEITDMCVTADGRLLACGSVDKLVRVWELEMGSPTAVLAAHQGTITAVHWAPQARDDLRWLATTSTDGSVAFWTCTLDGSFSGAPIQYVERMRPGVCHMICGAWSAGGAFLAAGSADHHVRVYAVQLDDIQSPRRVVETAVHSEAVDSLAWAHHSLRFVSGSKDGTAALWYLHAAHWRHSMLRVTSADATKKLKVTMVCWDRSDEFILTAVSDCTIRVWSSATSTQVASLLGHRDEVYVLEAHPILPRLVLSAGHDGQLLLWHLPSQQPIAKFHNHIPGQGDGAIFDAKWGGMACLAATDSHGHLLLLGLGRGHPLLGELPMELFFHTDYRPLIRDALGGALDEQSETPPHLLPPGLLVDVEGAPYPPRIQSFAPSAPTGTQTGRSQLDEMIEALAAGRADNDNNANREERAGGWGGVWRGGGVRHAGAGGGWGGGPRTRPIIPRQDTVLDTCFELNSWEQQQYRREMRRRPVMISTGSQRPPRPRNQRRRPAPRPLNGNEVQVRLVRLEDALPPSASSRGSSEDDSVQDDFQHSESADYSSHSMSKSDDDNSESSYSDWEAGNAALAPPARVRRKPQPAKRYSPTITTTKRAARAQTQPSSTGETAADPPSPEESLPGPSQVPELPELYRVGDWLTSVTPRKAPYIPQMGDVCLYFKLGHQRYFEAVAEKDLYKISPKDKPWETTFIHDCELVKVTGIKYELRPPRLACLRVARVTDGRGFTVRYHDMPDVIDFLVLREHYDKAATLPPHETNKFRCMIDDFWWTGTVTARSAPRSPARAGARADAAAFSAAAAPHFLSLTVHWDNGELERLSPWDLEPVPQHRLPSSPGGAVPVLPHELEEIVLRSIPSNSDWPQASKRIGELVSQVMSLSAAEPFVAPVDLQLYPNYALVVAYPVDLSTIRARFNNLFYRRAAAAQFDARYIAFNAERFNAPGALIVKQARLLTDLLLTCIAEWQTIDVVSKYHELAAAYRSSDEEPLANCKSSRGPGRGPVEWTDNVSRILRQLTSSADAEPFMRPVVAAEAPDYHLVISTPMDFGTVQERLSSGFYTRPQQFYDDVKLIFTNSRHYNTNKRTRIYSMTVRLQALFETLWLQVPCGPRGQRRTRRQFQSQVRTNGKSVSPISPISPESPVSSESDGETLAATSLRVHASSASTAGPGRGKGKGVGKKTVRVSSSASTPQPSTSRRQRDRSRSASSYSWSDDVPLNNHREEVSDQSSHRKARRRRRVSTESDVSGRKLKRKHRRKKIRRERVVDPSSSSSSSSSSPPPRPDDAGRYESDQSYHPLCSSDDDDDAPLTVYRQQKRSAPGSEAAPEPTTSRSRKHARLRRRGPQRTYNEDSDDAGASAISRRARTHRTPTHLLTANIRNATFNDHDYLNGHASTAAVNGTISTESSPRAEHSRPDTVSISSRGRVRKLTAKARGLLRE